jgi:formiminotetrahydrofolate cyclodeaminase
MLYVHADDDTSKQRNILRGKLGGRTIPEKIRSEIWNKVHDNKQHYQKMFGKDFHHVDNSIDFGKASDEEKQNQQKKLDNLHKHFRKEVESKNYTPAAKNWIDNRLRK